jgi:hypothetical protein
MENVLELEILSNDECLEIKGGSDIIVEDFIGI